MSTPVMLVHLILDALTKHDPGRVPEPDLVMDDPARVDAYMQAGQEDGFFAHLYFFHALQTCPLIRPGDRVLDLACGPANQLVQMARMNPEAHFIGLDASGNMLARAAETLRRSDAGNIELQHGDMTQLHDFADASIDAVVSTMSLHHLATVEALQATGREIRRVLRPGGGLYIVDFGRLKRHATRNFFVRDRQSKQSPAFAEDFRHSLAAAFSLEEIRTAFAGFGTDILITPSLIAPFMVALHSQERRRLDTTEQARLRQMFAALTRIQRRDFADFIRLFTYAGYPLVCPMK